MKNTSPKLRRVATVTSVFRTTTRFRLWLIPLLIVGLAMAGWWIRSELGDSARRQTAAKLQAFLDSDVNGLVVWLAAQKSFASLLAQSRSVGGFVGALERARMERGAEPEVSPN